MVEITFEIVLLITVLVVPILLGIIFQRKFIPRLRKRYARSKNANLRIFWSTIQGPSILIFLLGTVYLVTRYAPVPDVFYFDQINSGSLIALIIVFTYFLGQLFRNLLTFYIRKGRLPKTTIFNSLSNLFIVIIGSMLVLTTLGLSITPIVGALGIGGLAVALALQPTLANIFAGVSIIASKQINPGDFVQLNVTESGYVEDIQWRTTSIRTLQNNLIIIPNSQFSNLTIVNYSLPQQEQSLSIPVGVHYDSNLDQVRNVCMEVAREIQLSEEGAIREWEPRVRFTMFGQSSIDVNVVLRINEFTQQFHIRSEFIRKLRKRFHQEGIIIPYPITTVELADKGLKFDGSPEFQ